MKVFVTGATGFTGSHVVPLLLQNGYHVRCLYRPTSDGSLLPQQEIDWALGDLSNTSALTASMQGIDALVNSTLLEFGHAESIISATVKAGTQCAIFIGTIFTQLKLKQLRAR